MFKIIFSSFTNTLWNHQKFHANLSVYCVHPMSDVSFGWLMEVTKDKPQEQMCFLDYVL